MALDLDETQRQALRRAALSGDYHLFLGAGASRDSIGPSGSALPGSEELIKMLCKGFGVPAEDEDQLWRVYARAVDAAGETAVYDWLREGFWGVEPPYWMTVFARSPWAAVWTLNIDDTFEAAYSQISTDASRKLLTISWDDDFRFGRELNVIHLHGCVDREEPRRLVFSLSEYASSAVSRTSWPLNFRDSYGVAPFVILGARLRDEPDIEAVVAQRLPVHAAPSFYVSRTISAAAEQDMRSWNLIPVRMSAEDFAAEWAELTGLDLDGTPSEPIEIGFRVGRQFTELRTNETLAPPSNHDFLGGDEPVWSDIQRGLYADLDWIRRAGDECRQIGKRIPRSSVVIYTGRRLTGRSTGLLALARVLRSEAWRTFLFTAGERPDSEAIRRFASDGKSIALFFDGVADIADDVEALIRDARSSQLSIACVAVDDVDREANILGRIDSAYLAYGRIGNIERLLTRTDGARLVDTLNAEGRLGFLESEKNDRRRIGHFAGHELFDSMAQVENAPGFGRRVNELVNKLDDTAQMQLTLLASLASKADRTLLVIDASRMIADESEAVVRLIQTERNLGVLLATDGTWVRPRQRWMAMDACIAKLGAPEALSFIADALRRVAPRLSRASQIERNTTALLVGALMSQKNLAAAFPQADLESWYQSLSDVFGSWSGRYWEQRAIVARRRGQTDPPLLAKAESFAIRASEIVKDAYSLTTLGTVLLARAAYSPTVDVVAYYERGMKAFEQASQDVRGNVVGWIAYLQYTLPVLARVLDESGSAVGAYSDLESQADNLIPGEGLLEQVSDDWVRIYSQVAILSGSSENTASSLVNLRRRYDALMRGPAEDQRS